MTPLDEALTLFFDGAGALGFALALAVVFAIADTLWKRWKR